MLNSKSGACLTSRAALFDHHNTFVGATYCEGAETFSLCPLASSPRTRQRPASATFYINNGKRQAPRNHIARLLFTEQTFVFLFGRLITLACRFFQPLTVEDQDVSAIVADQVLRL